MDLRRLLILFFAILVVSSCDNDDSTRPIDSPALTTDEMVIADCYVVRDIVEAYAADNGNVFPFPGIPDNYFPGGRLENRYTGLVNLPISRAPYWPGEIGVIFFADSSMDYTGYRVTGRGRYGELIRLENVSRVPQEIVRGYDHVLANIDTVLDALDRFVAQAGYYPADLADTAPSGETIIDFLPGGQLLLNPFSGCECEPADGVSLGNPGGVGFLGTDQTGDGLIDDFAIDAYDLLGLIFAGRSRDSLENERVRRSSHRLRSAVDEFAAQNAGEYPHDLDTDRTPAGDTLRDLISEDDGNPYTGASVYRDGLATSRGEVGYQPLEYNGVVVGYVVNALGLFEEELERFEVLTN
jgi:hypothetical protein